MNQDSTVVGVFDNGAEAERAVQELKRAGFRDDQIGFAARGSEGAEGSIATGEGHNTGEGGVAKGVIGGGILGTILGAAAALLIPGIGPVVAGGILATALGGAAIGAAAGGLLGALTEMGVPEEDARYYDSEFQSGRTIVTVQAGNRRQEAWDILSSFGARDASNRGAGGMIPYDTAGAATTTTQTTQTASTARPAQANANTAEGAQKVQLREEQLTATKQAVEAGEVQLTKVVHEKEQQIPVNLKHEEIVVERHAVDRPLGQGEIGEFTEETISVPVYEEQAQLQKQAHVREEVSINKQQVQEQETFTGTTRHEHLNVESTGNVDIKGDVGNNVQNRDNQADQP